MAVIGTICNIGIRTKVKTGSQPMIAAGGILSTIPLGGEHHCSRYPPLLMGLFVLELLFMIQGLPTSFKISKRKAVSAWIFQLNSSKLSLSYVPPRSDNFWGVFLQPEDEKYHPYVYYFMIGHYWGQKDNTAGRSLVLKHNQHGLIRSIPYGPPSISKSDI